MSIFELYPPKNYQTNFRYFKNCYPHEKNQADSFILSGDYPS